MICPNPKCKNNKTDIKSEKQEAKRNEVLRNRYCSKCDTSFSTKEKINIITKRKPRPDKLLMNFRFYLYGNFRLVNINETMSYLEKNLEKKFGDRHIMKKKIIKRGFGKSKGGRTEAFFSYFEIKGNEEKDQKFLTVRAPQKKQSIEEILSKKFYWEYRNFVLKKDQIKNEDINIICSRINQLGIKKWRKSMKNNKPEYDIWNIAKKELENFYKSVAEYIVKKEKEYNQNFFINYRVEKKFSPWTEEESKKMSDYWKIDHCWKKYLISR